MMLYLPSSSLRSQMSVGALAPYDLGETWASWRSTTVGQVNGPVSDHRLSTASRSRLCMLQGAQPRLNAIFHL